MTTPPPPCSDANTSLGRLRYAMKDPMYTQTAAFDAFLVFFSDEHLSEEPAEDELRLKYVSGWDGVGTAAVMADEAALWVHTGDFQRANAMVSCAWRVYDMDDYRTITIADWIADNLERTGKRAGRIGGDARLTSFDEWQTITAGLHSKSPSHSLVHVQTLLDRVWDEEPIPERRRPEFSKIVANLHHEQYVGLSWREKISRLRNEIKMNGADAMVVTALDEVAWLLNVRGKDARYAPLLKAFVYVTLRDVRVYAPPGKLSMPVREALEVYSCHTPSANCTKIYDYANIYNDLRRATEYKIIVPSAATFQRGASAAIAQSVPQSKRVFLTSPIIYLKAQKNAAEIKGMHKAHLRDAVAMCTILNYLEGNVKNNLSELSVASKVDLTRTTQAHYVGVAMPTLVSFGPSGAEPDYRATISSNRKIFPNSTMIIRSGGQYDEGTTVVTRTVHYGTPSHAIRTAYTTVLRSLAAMSMLQIPESLPAAHTDPVARAPLWAARQDYPHPTGHGVGAALNRREDPVVIDYRQDTNLHTFRDGFFITAEPAWYERGKFGVRLGNVLEVEQKSERFLSFKQVTLLKWINAYNDNIRKIVGPELQEQGLTDVYYWLMNKTVYLEPFKMKNVNSGGQRVDASWSFVAAILIILAL
ncbi:metallopeptidase family m24 domain-containing protein [Phthorimaea operculella]|nr:metallopeptidase family m24 domain-containing protein [Phthorimaea operculella]